MVAAFRPLTLSVEAGSSSAHVLDHGICHSVVARLVPLRSNRSRPKRIRSPFPGAQTGSRKAVATHMVYPSPHHGAGHPAARRRGGASWKTLRKRACDCLRTLLACPVPAALARLCAVPVSPTDVVHDQSCMEPAKKLHNRSEFETFGDYEIFGRPKMENHENENLKIRKSKS